MKTIIFCATALTMTGATMAAGSDWTTLDREVEALSSSLAPQEGGVAIGGYLDFFYVNTSDVFDTDNDTTPDDVSAFTWNNARLNVSGETAGIGYYVSYQLIDSTLVDAYVTMPFMGMTATGGRLKLPMGASGSRAERDQFYTGYFGRTMIGNRFAGRQGGLQLSGNANQLNYSVMISNGDVATQAANDSGNTDEYQTTVHVDYAVMGSNSDTEGAYGAGDDMSLAFGVSWTDDGSVENSESATIVDMSLTSSTFSFSAEVADLGDGNADGTIDGSTGPGGSVNPDFNSVLPIGESPISLGGTFAINDAWEIGLRIQDLDLVNLNTGDDADAQIMSLAANHYVSGHDVKYTVQFDRFSADGIEDVDLLTIGLQVGF